MARASKFIKTKSNYVLKDKHQVLSNGTVFERDFMTISGSDGMSPAEEQYYRSSNFKFVVRNGINRQKKHTSEGWASDNGVSLSNAVLTSDVKIILNPDYESITDFAYYGSAVDMVRAALVDIALRFPAELYFSEETIEIGTGIANISAGTYYVVNNDYGLDIYTPDNGQEFDNELRYLQRSFESYQPQSWSGIPDECSCTISEPQIFETTCKQSETTGAIIAKVNISISNLETVLVYVYKLHDEIFYLYKNEDVKRWSLRPKQYIIDEFYNSLNDFERVLLNRDSRPIYTATFNTPYETEDGFFKYKRKYTWPSTYGWNPDLKGLGYESYVEELIRLASFHDEYDSNNIWRSMTHEAIKNLDWTFTKVQGENVDELESIDTSKVEPILKIYGRQYDDIKRKIDNITKSLVVTYDKKSNVPDYFIDDVLNLAGWETKAVNPGDNTVTTAPLYASTMQGYNAVDANNEFLRRLKISSPYILSAKGTRKGMDMVLGLFGMEKDVDYRISEHIVIASGTPLSYESVVDVNKKKYNYMESENDELQGLPLAKATYSGGDYVIPWFDKNKKYDGDTYFQMKGGWGRHIVNGVDNVTCQLERYDGAAYDETMSDIKIVRNIDELSELGRYVVKTGDICYVYDITDIEKHFPNIDANAFSHYFYLVDDEYVGTIGAVDGVTGVYGWLPVYNVTVKFSGDTAYTSMIYAAYEERGYAIEVDGDNVNVWVPLRDLTIVRSDEDRDKLGTSLKKYNICYVLNTTKYYWLGEDEMGKPKWEETQTEGADCKNIIRIHRINYLETIKDDTEGNNPHGGHGTYDDGYSYVERILKPFSFAVENKKIITEEAARTAESLNFIGDEETWFTIDNKKCWWFKDAVNEGASSDTRIYTDLISIEANNADKTNTSDAEYEKNTDGRPVFNNFIDSSDTGFAEAATDTIINVKNLSIEFKYPTIPQESYGEFEKYIKDKVLFYLRQVIPATTVFNYKFVSE